MSYFQMTLTAYHLLFVNLMNVVLTILNVLDIIVFLGEKGAMVFGTVLVESMSCLVIELHALSNIGVQTLLYVKELLPGPGLAQYNSV